MPKAPIKTPSRSKPSRSRLTKPSLGRIDFVLLTLVLILLGFGAVMIYDASIISAARDFGDKFFYVKNQLLWISVGLVAMFIASRLDYHIYYHFALPAYVICLILLLLVFIPMLGIGAYGAHRWLDFR